ncbi:MAG: S8 family serine peptidase [Methylococcaceae bacterium]
MIPALCVGIAEAGEFRQSYRPIPNQYIVIMRSPTTSSERSPTAEISVKANQIRSRFRGSRIHSTWNRAVRGLTVQMSAAQARSLAHDTDVALVEEDSRITINTLQSTPVWGLDRIDQINLPLDAGYTFNTLADNVTAYVIDTGIATSHSDLFGRVINGYSAFLAADGSPSFEDCNGHGTHVAGTIGGSTYGVAKGVKLVNIRVLDCTGSGTTSGVISGVNWVTQNRTLPAVANMSLGGGLSPALDLAVQNSIASGVTYVVAAGNENTLACNSSPAHVPEAITVGATDVSDNRASFSNYGSCVDLFAPGVNIKSSWFTSTTASTSLSGTSMASPHVAGAAALFLANQPGATPSTVSTAITSSASVGKVQNPGNGSPNRLLFSGDGSIAPAPDSTPPTITLTSPSLGQSLTGTTIVSANASDNVGVSKVDFYVDSILVASSTSSPYSASWNSASVPDGAHQFSAKATDSSGLTAITNPLQVTVANNIAIPACGKSSQLIANNGFELGAVNWTATSGVINNSATDEAYSGTWKAKLGGMGKTTTHKLSQIVGIPVDACSASLSLYLKISTTETTKTRAYDTFTIRVVNPASGRVIKTLGNYSNLNKSATYRLINFDLLAYRGKTVRLEMISNEDVSFATSFLVDDTVLNITQ